MWLDFVFYTMYTCFISSISFFAWHSSSSSFPWVTLLIWGLRLKLQLHIFHLLRVEQDGLLLQVMTPVLQLLLLSACLVFALHKAVSHLDIFLQQAVSHLEIYFFGTWIFFKLNIDEYFLNLNIDNIGFGCFDKKFNLRVQSISVVWHLRHFLMKIVNRVDQPA